MLATEEYCLGAIYDNIYLYDYLKNQQKLILWPESPCSFGTNLVSKLGYGNGLIIVTEEMSDSIECCCFLSNKNNLQINEFFIKHNDVLRRFANHFKQQNFDIITNSNQCKAKYKDGYGFYLSNEKENVVDIKSFFSTSGIEGTAVDVNGRFIYLTDIEVQCLELIAQNFSLKKISEKLLLSQNIAEAHITNIKDKTGFYHRNDLVEIYNNAFIEKVS
jgi:DNA-binding CsgD family transcriptional regulator